MNRAIERRSATNSRTRTRSRSTTTGAVASGWARLTIRTSWPRAARRLACSHSIRSPPPSGRVGDTSDTMRTRSRAVMLDSTEAPGSALVEILAHPLLEHHQSPQTIGVGPGALQVLALEGLDGVG